MSDKVEKIVNDAVSNVSCETEKKVSSKTLKKIKEHLLGMSGKSEDSFIYSLVEAVTGRKEMKHGKRK